MMTPRDYAVNAAEALRGVFQGSPMDYEVARVADVIEKAIKEATLEREDTERQREAEVQAAVQQQVARLLTSSPAVIYSFAATENFAPSFVSENIRELFGYPTDNFQHPNFCRERAHPVTSREAMPRFSGLPQSGIHKLHHRFHRQGGSYGRWNDPRNLICGKYGTPLEVVRS